VSIFNGPDCEFGWVIEDSIHYLLESFLHGEDFSQYNIPNYKDQRIYVSH